MTLLLLAGTAEARAIARALAGADVIATLAGVTQAPAPLAVPVQVGGFGGEAGFAAFLAARRIHAVLDATHPFASAISARSARICAAQGLPYCQLLRPPWQPGPGDRWVSLASPAAAAAVVPPGARVLLATGRQSLPDFAALGHGRQVFCRVVDPPQTACPLGEWLVARPPFALADEIALLADLRIDWLVAKNAGGAAGLAKLAAARRLGLPVALLARPPAGAWQKVASVEQALAWVAAWM